MPSLNTVIIALIVASIALFIAKSLSSKTPDNESRLNLRQKFAVACFISASAAIFTFFYSVAPEIYKKTLIAFFSGMEIIGFVLWLYEPFIYFSSVFKKKKRNYAPLVPTMGKKNKFAVIGCAHNEEAVIEQLIQSVYKSDYDPSLYDVYIICDNCTDNTADVVRKAGAKAMERNDIENRGKGHGLSWMFNILREWEKDGLHYDAYVVLDADNLISPRFFRAINRKLNEGYEILQTYLGCKNPDDSWISRSYSIAYWLSNTSYQKAHARLGISAQMGGTGMVFRPSVLEEVNWRSDSLTEDLLITARYILKKNRPACWVHDARIYDEKPLKLKQSVKQRTRWMQGHMDTMVRYFRQLIVNGVKKRSWLCFDMAIYLIRPLFNFSIFFTYLIRALCGIFMPNCFISQMHFLMTMPLAVGLFLVHLLLQCFVLKKAHRTKYIAWLPVQLLFSLTWHPAIFRGLIKFKERYWVSTVHTRSMSIEDTYISKEEAAATANIKKTSKNSESWNELQNKENSETAYSHGV